MKKIEEVLKVTVEYLNENDIDYVLLGGFAVIVYGNPRTTVDLDLIVDIDKGELEEFANYLHEKDFFCDVEDMKTAFENKTHFSAEEKGSLFRLDIKGVYDSNDRITLNNRKKIEYENLEMYVGSPEDIIANKLYFGSEQDVEDAESIFVRQEERLDRGYLQDRCESLGVEEELEEMIRDIDDLKRNI